MGVWRNQISSVTLFHPNFKEKYTTSDRLTPHINFVRLQLDLSVTTETGNRSVGDMTHYCNVTWALLRPKPSLPPLFSQQLIEGNINVSKIYASKRDPTKPSWKGPHHTLSLQWRYNGRDASQITSLTIVYSTVYSYADQRKHQSSSSLAFVQGIYRWPVNFLHKWPVTRKMFSFDDVIIRSHGWVRLYGKHLNQLLSMYILLWSITCREISRHVEAETKWPSYGRQHFEMRFIQ